MDLICSNELGHYTELRASGVFAVIRGIRKALNIAHNACLHCTLPSFGFCSGELIVLLFAVEMDRSAGRQRLLPSSFVNVLS